MAAVKLVPEVSNISNSSFRFGFDLFRLYGQKQKNENLFLSPFSISTALAMTHLGARGQTATEMKKVLHWRSDEEIERGFASYLPLLKESNGPGYVLNATQRVYVRKGLSLQEKFSAAAKEKFGSDAREADFAGNADGERVAINQWVSDETRGKVTDLLPSGSLNPLTAMVLIQATYFKGKWQNQFDASKTKKAEFYAPTGTVMVDMMRMEEKIGYGHSDELKCTAVELPYKSNKSGDQAADLSMIVLLPNEQDGLESLEAAISQSPDKFDKLLSRMSPVKVNLQLPRFSMESSYQLKEALSSLGMPTAFSDNADFTGMANDLYISEVFHKAVVDVNEEGSEAAAATGVVMMLRSLPRIEHFVADHPFLFFILDKRANFVLFMGRLCKPAAASDRAKQEL